MSIWETMSTGTFPFIPQISKNQILDATVRRLDIIISLQPKLFFFQNNKMVCKNAYKTQKKAVFL